MDPMSDRGYRLKSLGDSDGAGDGRIGQADGIADASLHELLEARLIEKQSAGQNHGAIHAELLPHSIDERHQRVSRALDHAGRAFIRCGSLEHRPR